MGRKFKGSSRVFQVLREIARFLPHSGFCKGEGHFSWLKSSGPVCAKASVLAQTVFH
jgi:hypothetical protein